MPSPRPRRPGSADAAPPPGIGDGMFRRVVSAGTGLAFAGMLASLAVIERGAAGKLVLRWHWAAVPLTAAGLAAGFWFWRLVWRAERDGTPGARSSLRRFSVCLAAMAVTSFAYPMRFIQEERRTEVFIGLGLAIAVLGTFGFVIWKTIQWVNENEPRDGEVEADPDGPAGSPADRPPGPAGGFTPRGSGARGSR